MGVTARMPTIYILHGWAPNTDGEKWRSFLGFLEGAGFKVKFLSMPGFEVQLTKAWTLQDFVNWLKGEIEAEEKAILLGHSFGGQIAIRFASQYPDKIKKLVLIANSGMRDKVLHKRLKRIFFYVLSKLGKPIAKSERIRKAYYTLIGAEDYLAATGPLRETMGNVLKDEIRKDLPKIICPTLVVWGRSDKVTPPKHGRFVAENIKNAELKIVSGARHSPQFTHAKEVAVLVTQFLR